MRRRMALVLVPLLLALAGCAGAPSPGSPAAPPVGPAVPVPLEALRCGASPGGASGTLPDREWVAVASCPLQAVHVVPGAPLPSASPVRPRVLRGDLRPLLAALRQPDAPPARMCADSLVILPPFWLVDRDSQAYRPRVPLGPCHQPAQAVIAALGALHAS